MKDDKRNNTDELMDAWEGIRPEYLEEADQVFLHGKKGQRRRRTAVLLAAAAVFIAAVGIGMVLIIRNYTGKSDVSTDLTVRQDSSIETVPEESGTLSYEESKAAEEAEAAREAMEKAEKEREASLSEEAEKEAAYEASKAADAAKQAEEAAKQAKTEQEAFLAEAAEKEEKLNREDFTYRLPGCFRRLVIKSDGSIIVDSADSIYISPQSPSIMQESLLCTYGESVYQASASGSGGRTVWEVYDQSACERGEKLFEIHALVQNGGDVEQFLLQRTSGSGEDYRLYVRDHSADYSISGNYLTETDGGSEEPVRSLINITVPEFMPDSKEMRLFMDGSYIGAYRTAFIYDEEGGQYVLLAYDDKSDNLSPVFTGAVLYSSSSKDTAVGEAITLYQYGSPSGDREVGTFIKAEPVHPDPESEFMRFLSELDQPELAVNLGSIHCTDAEKMVLELPRLLSEGDGEVLQMYNASGTISSADMKRMLAQDFFCTEVSTAFLGGHADEMIVLQTGTDQDRLLAVLENTGLIVFLNQGEIHCFMPALSGSAVGRFSLRGWYDEALCYAAGDVTMKGEAIRIPDRGQSYIEAVQEYFDSRNEIRMKLPHGCKYANLYAKSIVEEADTKEVPAQYRERYENDSHEILGAFRCTNIWAPENEAAYHAQIAGVNTEYSGDDPEVPDGAYWGTIFGWARKDPDGWWYIAVDGTSLGWPPDG